MYKSLLYFAVVTILSTSCVSYSVSNGNNFQKRKYRNGWYLNFKDSNQPSVYNLNKNSQHISVNKISVFSEFSESVNKQNSSSNIQLLKLENKTPFSPKTEINDLKNVLNFKHKSIEKTLEESGSADCDVITLRDGKDIEAKVEEITPNFIKYKMCDNLNGPLITIEKEKVFSVKYTNGQKTVFNTESNSNSGILDYEDGKSQLLALALCLVFGGLGFHRFYLGYTTIGIIQLLTAGGCGIWFLIDLVRIITGDLKPKNGDYTEKL